MTRGVAACKMTTRCAEDLMATKRKGSSRFKTKVKIVHKKGCKPFKQTFRVLKKKK